MVRIYLSGIVRGYRVKCMAPILWFIRPLTTAEPNQPFVHPDPKNQGEGTQLNPLPFSNVLELAALSAAPVVDFGDPAKRWQKRLDGPRAAFKNRSRSPLCLEPEPMCLESAWSFHTKSICSQVHQDTALAVHVRTSYHKAMDGILNTKLCKQPKPYGFNLKPTSPEP